MVNIIIAFLIAIFGIFLIIYSYVLCGKKNPLSVTFIGIIVGVVGVWILAWQPTLLIGNIEKMSITTAQFYYNQIMETLRVVFTGLILAITILFVGFKSKKWFLRKQVLLLFLFFLYVAIVVYFTIISDLQIQIAL